MDGEAVERVRYSGKSLSLLLSDQKFVMQQPASYYSHMRQSSIGLSAPASNHQAAAITAEARARSSPEHPEAKRPYVRTTEAPANVRISTIRVGGIAAIGAVRQKAPDDGAATCAEDSDALQRGSGGEVDLHGPLGGSHWDVQRESRPVDSRRHPEVGGVSLLGSDNTPSAQHGGTATGGITGDDLSPNHLGAELVLEPVPAAQPAPVGAAPTAYDWEPLPSNEYGQEAARTMWTSGNMTMKTEMAVGDIPEDDDDLFRLGLGIAPQAAFLASRVVAIASITAAAPAVTNQVSSSLGQSGNAGDAMGDEPPAVDARFFSEQIAVFEIALLAVLTLSEDTFMMSSARTAGRDMLNHRYTRDLMVAQHLLAPSGITVTFPLRRDAVELATLYLEQLRRTEDLIQGLQAHSWGATKASQEEMMSLVMEATNTARTLCLMVRQADITQAPAAIVTKLYGIIDMCCRPDPDRPSDELTVLLEGVAGKTYSTVIFPVAISAEISKPLCPIASFGEGFLFASSDKTAILTVPGELTVRMKRTSGAPPTVDLYAIPGGVHESCLIASGNQSPRFDKWVADSCANIGSIPETSMDKLFHIRMGAGRVELSGGCFQDYIGIGYMAIRLPVSRIPDSVDWARVPVTLGAAFGETPGLTEVAHLDGDGTGRDDSTDYLTERISSIIAVGQLGTAEDELARDISRTLVIRPTMRAFELLVDIASNLPSCRTLIDQLGSEVDAILGSREPFDPLVFIRALRPICERHPELQVLNRSINWGAINCANMTRAENCGHLSNILRGMCYEFTQLVNRASTRSYLLTLQALVPRLPYRAHQIAVSAIIAAHTGGRRGSLDPSLIITGNRQRIMQGLTDQFLPARQGGSAPPLPVELWMVYGHRPTLREIKVQYSATISSFAGYEGEGDRKIMDVIRAMDIDDLLGSVSPAQWTHASEQQNSGYFLTFKEGLVLVACVRIPYVAYGEPLLTQLLASYATSIPRSLSHVEAHHIEMVSATQGGPQPRGGVSSGRAYITSRGSAAVSTPKGGGDIDQQSPKGGERASV